MPRAPRKPRVDSLEVSARVAKALAAEFGVEEAARVAAGLTARQPRHTASLRLPPLKLAAYKAAAEREGMSWTAWVERALDAALERPR